MASPLYDDLAATAVELLAEYGQPIVLTRTGGTGEYDPNTGTVDSDAGAAYGGHGFVLAYEQSEVDGSLIQQGDRHIFIDPALQVTPVSGDIVTLEDGSRLEVVTSRPLSPAGVVVLHDIQARGI